MSYAVNETKDLPRPAAEVLAAADAILDQLGAKRSTKPPVVEGQLQAEFNKQVGGRAFTNRVQLTLRVVDGGSDRCTATVDAYPIDPLGKPLRFGVLGQPARLVTTAFWERLEARLSSVAAAER